MKKEIKLYEIKTSKGSVRKYPNVIWFPRSKTDPREIREVLKLAIKTQNDNSGGFFNDKLLGEYMARIGSISVVGLEGKKYVESYKGKSIGDVSYITNARMLMRLFRFLGFVTRIEKGKYIVTDLGRLYCKFAGDFPDYAGGVSEERVLLDSLSNFAFYNVNDDPAYRDAKFMVRPFVWLLHTIALEPQCIFQLIVTAFASKSESTEETQRIKSILANLRSGSSNLKKEWRKVGLDSNNYSCVHNFYDSVKILVYLGASLGLVHKTADPAYGKKIAGGGRHLKQASAFYAITEKGIVFLKQSLPTRVLYFDQVYKTFGDSQSLQVAVLLASLNHHLGNIKIDGIKDEFFEVSFDIDNTIRNLNKNFSIKIIKQGGFLVLESPISFSFYQSIPPEILQLEIIQKYYNKLMSNFPKNKLLKTITTEHSPTEGLAEFSPYFELDKKRRYSINGKGRDDLVSAIKYAGKEDVFGGRDRFSSRVSPTNSVVLDGDKLFINNSLDALDLLVPLRIKDPALIKFIEENTVDLVNHFITKSDIWEKDQHYTWVRNCFRHFDMEAVYSGSGGMLSRADVSIISPLIGGIEIKSPRENRGTVSTKAIRQAVDAKIQVAAQHSQANHLPRAAIAIGRRITTQAINEEQKWAKEKQPILLLNDVVLHYLVLKSASINLSQESLVNFFTANHGFVNSKMIMDLFAKNTSEKNKLNKIEQELRQIDKYIAPETNGEEPNDD